MRINHRIKVSPVRLIGPDGEQVGILPTNEALARAREAELDLVEVSPNSRPPVCRIMDYGKYKYELSKKDKLAKKKQHVYQLKEMRYRPKIDEHDYSFKTKHVRSFLESGSKVKAFVFFRGRELAHKELGREVLDRLIADVADIAIVDVQPQFEGRRMNMILSPKPEIVRQLNAAKAEKHQPRPDNRDVESADEENETVTVDENGTETDDDSDTEE